MYQSTKTFLGESRQENLFITIPWVFENFGGGNIDKISFGINAQTNNSFHNDFHIKGLNNLNSIDKFFLNNATR